MLNARAAKRLFDVKAAPVHLGEFRISRSRDEFLKGGMFRDAIERKAGILASAVAASVREAPELKNRLTGWERVASLDEYLSLDATIADLKRLWDVVTKDVPPLLIDMEAVLGSLLGRKNDLVDDKEFENPYFAYSVRKTRMSIFEMSDGRQGAGAAPTRRDSSLRSE